MAWIVGTTFDQDDNLKTTMNISDILVGLARKLAFRMERDKQPLDFYFIT